MDANTKKMIKDIENSYLELERVLTSDVLLKAAERRSWPSPISNFKLVEMLVKDMAGPPGPDIGTLKRDVTSLVGCLQNLLLIPLLENHFTEINSLKDSAIRLLEHLQLDLGKTYLDLKNSLHEKSLQDFLSEVDQLNPHQENIIRFLKEERGYADDELSNLYGLISKQGRLFVSCLLSACNHAGVSDAVTVLQSLAEKLKIIETYSASYAHFIWVGPPSASLNELLGVRSLKEAKKDQEIYFWVLDEHVVAYQDAIKKLGLSHVHVVSIEGYAKKTGYQFGKGESESLVAQIEYFKRLADKKMKEASQLTDQAAKQLKIIDAIRDRVTIVDHVKPLIPLFEGGHVCDVDLTFVSAADESKATSLPDFAKWAFPVMGGWSPDVWYFYCQRTVNWDGITQRYLGDMLADDKDRHDRDTQLNNYNQLARKAYQERGDKPLDGAFPVVLGNAICKIAGELPVPCTKKDSEHLENMLNLNDYYHAEDGHHCLYIGYFVHTRYGLKVDSLRMSLLTLPADIKTVKYYGQSYVPSKANEGQKPAPPIHVHLLTIKDKVTFSSVLSQRLRFTNLDIATRFNVLVEEMTLYNTKPPIEVKDATMLHLALLIRPDLFPIILNEVPFEKMSGVMSMEAKIPGAIFDSRFEPQAHTILSLTEKLQVTTGYRDISQIRVLMDDAKKNIENAQIALWIYEVLPRECKEEMLKYKTIEAKLNFIIDCINERPLLNHNFFPPPLTPFADEIKGVLVKLGVIKVGSDEVVTIEKLKDHILSNRGIDLLQRNEVSGSKFK